MATRRLVTGVDDVDGSGDAHTVRFGLDGEVYEIDLIDAHARKFRGGAGAVRLGERRLTRNGRPYTRIDLDQRASTRDRRSARKPRR